LVVRRAPQVLCEGADALLAGLVAATLLGAALSQDL
jgi:hypothetical protein